MTDPRRNEIMEEFRRPPNSKSSRSRQLKNRFHHLRSKDTFLTDTQTSDYTKSSGEINGPKIEHLEEIIRKLQRQNAELRQRILDLKANQCFQINGEKLKNVLRQTEYLKTQLEQTQKELEQSLVERDFLERFNKNLKAQCQSLTKEILVIKATNGCADSKKPQKNIYTSRDEGVSSNKSRNSSTQMGITNKRKQFMLWKKEKDEKESSNMLKNSLSASQLQEDYYGGRSSRQRPLKNH